MVNVVIVTMTEEEVVQVVQRTCRKAVKIIATKVADTVASTAAVESVAEAAADAVTESVAEAAAELVSESLVESAAESIAEAAIGAATESLAEAVAEATIGSVAEAAVEAAAEVAADVVAESIVEAAVEPLSDVVLEAVAEAVTEAASEAILESVSEAASEAIVEAVTEAASDAVVEAITEAASEAVVEAVAEAASEAVVEAVTEAASDAVVEAVAEAASEAVVEAVTEAASEAVVEAASESVVEAAAESIVEAATQTAAAGVQAPVTALNMLGYETMNYRQIYQAMAGKSLSDDEYLEPYIASILFLIIVISLGYLLRKLTKSILPGSISVYFIEFITTMEACSYFFENNFILKHYGYAGFFVAIVLEILISNRTFEGASENPIKALDEFSKREITFDIAIVKIVFQAFGGLASYRLAQLVWSLDMVPDHRDRFFETSCSTDLATSIFLGFLVETGAALVDTWMGKQSLSANSLIDEVIKALNGGAMIVAGVSLTGMYYNPAMATGHMLGCQGNELWELILVYWVGPFVGCVLAILLDKVLRIENGKLAE